LFRSGNFLVLQIQPALVALKRLPAGAFGIMTSLEPAVAAFLGWIVLHEHLTASQWLAIVCVMAAAAGSSLTQAPAMHRGPADEIVQ
ncbi:EamA family transporter, partial [Arthrospira platensis SPKY1]|nr:EamA family transporter [Arthrospira platensis SPKY1]